MYNTLSETHIHNQSTSHGFYHLFQLDIKKISFGPLGKWGVVFPKCYEIQPNGKKFLVNENENNNII